MRRFVLWCIFLLALLYSPVRGKSPEEPVKRAGLGYALPYLDSLLESSMSKVGRIFSKTYNKALSVASHIVRRECTHPPVDNIGLIEQSLLKRTCGQELLVQELVGYLSTRDAKTDRPLVLSWNGATGIGKTYLTEVLGSHMAVYSLIDPAELTIARVRDLLEQCNYPVIVLEDVDLHPTLVDAIIKYYTIDPAGVRRARKAVFILTMNLGAGAIERYVASPTAIADMKADRFATTRHKHLPALRSALLRDMAASSSQDARSFWTQAVERNVIAAYLPFLPLGPAQVACCVRGALERKVGEGVVVVVDGRSVRVRVVCDVPVLSAALAGMGTVAHYYTTNGLTLSEGGCRNVEVNVENELSLAVLRAVRNTWRERGRTEERADQGLWTATLDKVGSGGDVRVVARATFEGVRVRGQGADDEL